MIIPNDWTGAGSGEAQRRLESTMRVR